MKVKELIRILQEQCNPELEIRCFDPIGGDVEVNLFDPGEKFNYYVFSSPIYSEEQQLAKRLF